MNRVYIATIVRRVSAAVNFWKESLGMTCRGFMRAEPSSLFGVVFSQ